MIDARELRIFNWVYFKWFENNEYLILDAAEFSVRVIDHECKELSPIPLTTEILKKCGFNLDRVENYVWFRKNNCPIQIFNDLEQVCYGAFSIDITIKSLHQLQNLYFALTNSELNIKL